jgi:fatty-acyl-CoA synthase
MLTRSTRAQFNSLLDAVTLTSPDDSRQAIVYLETDQPPIIVKRADFRHEALRYADALAKIGIQPRDLVIIAHTQNLESIYAFWGAMLAGAIPSMFPTLTEKLDPDIYMRGMAELVKLSDVRAVLTTDDFAPTLAVNVGCPVYGSSQLKISASDSPSLRSGEGVRGRGGDIAFLQHSSGTTGLQKGVALSHEAVLNQLASYSDSIVLNEQDVIVSWLPLYHDMGLIAGFLLPLIQGVPLVLMSPFDWVAHPAQLFRAISDYHGTLCWLPNFAYNHCARRIRQRDTEGLSAASMRLFINCSEPVHAESHRLFAERFAAQGVTPEMLTVSYAMAENTFAVTQTPLGEVPHIDIVDRAELENNRRAVPAAADHPRAVTKVSCGRPIAGTAVRVVNPEGTVLVDRQVGELAVSSDCMLTEYYKRPDLQPFKDGWYLTGDMGYIVEGEVYVIGRYKDLIINAGKNVYPQDIEAIANMVSGVHAGRVVAFGVSDEREGTELIAVVAEVGTDDAAERQQIAQIIRQTVARQSTVTLNYVHLVNDRWLIKTSSGKIARAANRDKWLAERAERDGQA